MTRGVLAAIGAFVVLAAADLVAQPVGDGALAEPLRNLPANKWTRVPCTQAEGMGWSPLVYDPDRKQVLQWGAVRKLYQVPYHPRNDVLAFDAGTGDWTSDYPSDKGLQELLGGKAGVSVGGWASMLPSGRPTHGHVVHAACYDSKRKQIVYPMPGMMAAYDPVARKWTDLKAKTVIYGSETPGGPPVYGAGAGYDPVNDEIIMFPHFGGGELLAEDRTLVDATGEMPQHFGTLRYGFADNTWRRVADALGSDELRATRKDLIALMGSVSQSMDATWALRRRPAATQPANPAKALEAASADAAKLALPAEAKAAFEPVPALLASAAKSVADGKLDDAMVPLRDALWAMHEVLDTRLRVEPQPRCATPLVCDPKNQCLVMFGGWDTTQARNDTWVYDCRTRQWRELLSTARPPGQLMPMLAYDPASGLMVLATVAGDVWDNRRPKVAQIWTLDVAKGQWAKRVEEPWKWPLSHDAGRPDAMLAMDASREMLLLVQRDGDRIRGTYVMPFDASKLPLLETPPAKAPAYPRPMVMPADDPAWVAKLRNLPANQWVGANSNREPADRAWGNVGCDQIRGWVAYVGGGHSTYQVNDADIYAVGANTWVRSSGCHNDHIPPQSWEGTCGGYNGGPRAGHMRNQYDAADGRLYLTDQSGCGNLGTFFLDIDRGGVWRHVHEGLTDEQPFPQLRCRGNWVRDPRWSDYATGSDGRLVGRLGASLGVFDPYTRHRTIANVPAGLPPKPGECRNFCYLGDRQQVFHHGYTKDTPPSAAVYDIKSAKVIKLEAPKPPTKGLPGVVMYLEGHDAVLVVVQTGEKTRELWVYSLKDSKWGKLPWNAGGMSISNPYGQCTYVQKYGVLVNVGSWAGRTMIMRPDLSQAKWSD